MDTRKVGGWIPLPLLVKDLSLFCPQSSHLPLASWPTEFARPPSNPAHADRYLPTRGCHLFHPRLVTTRVRSIERRQEVSVEPVQGSLERRETEVPCRHWFDSWRQKACKEMQHPGLCKQARGGGLRLGRQAGGEGRKDGKRGCIRGRQERT